jgi:hypothetical protein
MSKNEITFTANGGASYVGPKGVNVFRLRCLAGAIRLYAKTGMIPTRGVTITKMMKQAEQDTGKKFKKRDYITAALEVEKLFMVQAGEVAQEMKSDATSH